MSEQEQNNRNTRIFSEFINELDQECCLRVETRLPGDKNHDAQRSASDSMTDLIQLGMPQNKSEHPFNKINQDPRLLKSDQCKALIVPGPRRLPPPLYPAPPSCSMVSFDALPSASGWDQSWEERFRDLTAQDILVLRRQFLQKCSLLMHHGSPILGRGSLAFKRIEELHNREKDFLQKVVELAPHAWMMTSCYDMETLQAVEPHSLIIESLHNILKFLLSVEMFESSKTDSWDYDTHSKKLQAECAQLLKLYESLESVPDLGILSPVYGRNVPADCKHHRSNNKNRKGKGYRFRETADGTEQGHGQYFKVTPSKVANCIKENLRQQCLALQQYLSDVELSKCSMGNIKIGLWMYPLSFNALDVCQSLITLSLSPWSSSLADTRAPWSLTRHP